MVIRSQNPQPVHPVGDGSPMARGTAPNPPGIEQIRAIVGEGVRLVKRRRRVFGVVAGSVGALLLAFVFVQTALFEATSLMLVKFGREQVYQSEVGAETTLTSRDKETMINSELAILRSRPVLLGVVRSVGLATLYPDLAESLASQSAEAVPGEGATLSTDDAGSRFVYAKAVERLAASLGAQALPDADVLSVSFQHPDPFVAERTVQEVVLRFLEAHVEAYADPGVATFLDQRVAEYEARLDESEERLLEFETQHAAFALESPQTTLMQWRDETMQELSELENRVAQVRMGALEDAAVSGARNTLMNLQLEVDRLEGQLREDTEQRIQVVRRFIAQRRAEVEREVSTFDEKKQELLARLEGIDQELTEFPKLSAEYRRLRRERDADEEQYAIYQRRLRDARLSADMDREKIASISIIQPASAGPEPVWPPSKKASFPLVVILALVAGGLSAVLVDRLGGTGVRWLDEGAEAA